MWLRIATIAVGVMLIAAGIISLRDPDPVGGACETGSDLSCLVIQQRFKGGPYTRMARSTPRATSAPLPSR